MRSRSCYSSCSYTLLKSGPNGATWHSACLSVTLFKFELKFGSRTRPQTVLHSTLSHAYSPDGFLMGPDGFLMGPDGFLMGPDGSLMGPDGSLMGPDGSLMGPDGSLMGPDRSLMGPYGSLVGPDGFLMCC